MDGRFLSDPKVVAASRAFVCIRLATYESKEEAEVLKSIFVGRSGDLENTTFALLTPDGKKIGRAGRSPDFVYDGPEAMSDAMNKIAAQYSPKDAKRELPIMKNVRLALDVAACDGLPMVIALGRDKADLAKQAERLNESAWSDAFQGRFVYAETCDAKELSSIAGVTIKNGFIVVQPDTYGLKGKVLAEGNDESVLKKGLSAFKAEAKDPRQHIEEGHRRGVNWKTEIPDTDPGPPGGRPPR
jgi:hypothetical protein